MRWPRVVNRLVIFWKKSQRTRYTKSRAVCATFLSRLTVNNLLSFSCQLWPVHRCASVRLLPVTCRPDLSGWLAQLVRAPVSHTGGHRFESCAAHQKTCGVERAAGYVRGVAVEWEGAPGAG